MKILYAAGNRVGSIYQLKRFLDSIKNKKYTIKTAAYKLSMGNLNVDYNLDSLLNFTNPNTITFNGNYNYYYNEIKNFKPDLIISDFEIYSSIIAIELGIKLWQFSPILLFYALPQDIKVKLKVYKNYSYIFDYNIDKTAYYKNILNNSDKKLIPSHICDCFDEELNKGYEFVRPSFVLGENLNNYNSVIAMHNNNKDIINVFKNTNSALFSSYTFEKYNKLVVEDIDNEFEYKNSLDNCNFVVSDGTPAFLADAFYNQKFCYSKPRYDDVESLTYSYINEYYGIGKVLNSLNFNEHKKLKIKINNDIKFLSEVL